MSNPVAHESPELGNVVRDGDPATGNPLYEPKGREITFEAKAAIDPERLALREALERLLDAWNRRHIAPEWMTLMGIAAQKADAALAAAYEREP